jgi:hypothetical protein
MLATIIEQKKCSWCKEYLDTNKFYTDKSTSSGLSNRCKECRKQTRYVSKKEVQFYKNNIVDIPCSPRTDWSREALRRSKTRAKEKGLQHNLTRDWLLTNLPTHCPVLGIELAFGGNSYNSPSVDRFDNNKGYTTDNVRIISFRANALKSNATVEELEAIVRYMRNE